ncbi:MAG: amino acid ABC transporter ATP-binding protein [Erysipelotrichaceae bacterium]|nr:amino acid ABC transporter ATP-binding protein [Erysipelotrichaceae bacterium]
MIQANNLSKNFSGMHALKGASLSVERGEVVCLIGPSGSGKSTFLRCIHGLEKPDGGEVYLEGKLLDPKNKEEYRALRNKMGFVFQHFNLFPNLTVLENCTFAQMQVLKRTQEEATENALSYLGKVGLLEKKDSYPNNLSGGQKQRVAIARALCMNPEIMLFDEPTSALDPEMIKEVLEVIQELAAQGMTMIVVTHEMGFARKVGTKIVFLEAGHVIEEAGSEEFFTAPKTDRAKEFLSKVIYD